MHIIELPRKTVDDVQVVEKRGPWKSKSGGTLEVAFALPRAATEAFLDFDNPEFDEIERVSGEDVRGLRSYTVRGIAAGQVGGKEVHLARTEYVTALAGAALWTCVDFEGNTREVELDGTNAVIQPPGIYHEYKALADDTDLQVICNTLYVVDNTATYDTYFQDDFYGSRAQAYLA